MPGINTAARTHFVIGHLTAVRGINYRAGRRGAAVSVWMDGGYDVCVYDCRVTCRCVTTLKGAVAASATQKRRPFVD